MFTPNGIKPSLALELLEAHLVNQAKELFNKLSSELDDQCSPGSAVCLVAPLPLGNSG